MVHLAARVEDLVSRIVFQGLRGQHLQPQLSGMQNQVFPARDRFRPSVVHREQLKAQNSILAG